MNQFRRFALNRVGITAAVMAMLLQPLIAYSVAISPTLAESPLNGLNPVKPNIMFTLDDSGSMADDFLPDYVGGSSVHHCRDKRSCGAQLDPPIRSSAYNSIYYDPTTSYVAGVKSNGDPLPCEGTDATCGSPWISVFANGFANYPSATNGTTINLTTGYPDTVWCNKSGPSAADKQTAVTPALGGTGTGTVCRLNGIPYPLVGAGTNQSPATPAVMAGYNYPNATNPTTGVTTTCPANTTCKFTTAASITVNPYYYTVAPVQFCSTQDAGGWGSGTCTSDWNATTANYARYGGGSFDPTVFTRYDIRPSGLVVNGVSAAYPGGRSYAGEMANFAKWYAFYRTRILAMKTAGGIAFSALNSNSRVGFHTLRYSQSGYGQNDNRNAFLNIKVFDTANKETWFTSFYSANVGGYTPLPDATWRIGELFSGNFATSGLPSATEPLDLDTGTGKCQPNYHLLSTDGYWNDPLNYPTRGNDDKTVPSLANLPGATGFDPASQFPRPYYEGPTAYSNSLSDLGMYYWIRDIRPTVPNQGKDSIAPWQHVTLYGLSIGAQGTVPYPDGIAAISSGTRIWPNPNTGGPEAIDDLWHAAINSRGKFFNAKNAQELAESVVSALDDFTDQSGTGTGVGLVGAQLTETYKYAYKTSYESGLWGDVKKYELNVTTGVLPVDASGNPASPPLWSAATQLDAQVAVTATVTGWDTNRKIVTRNDATKQAVAFRIDNLSATQRSGLNAGWSSVSSPPTSLQVLNYLRGDQSNEGINTTSFRTRSHVLGDIVYSGAVPVGPPNLPYVDASNPGYESFKTTRASRASAVYVGANDGMVHAFDDTATNGGKETWAYIPTAVYTGGDPNDSAHTPNPAFSIGALAYRRGGLLPRFEHKFYVNATPRAWDVDFTNTNVSNVDGPPKAGNDWHTLLIGGLGAGGRAVYALDVTIPVGMTDTEASIASSGRALWDFAENNLGYVFDPPTLVKTYRYGWVALVASGFNNPGGKGFLYVLNPRTGAVLKKLALPGDSGSDTNPTGLSTIRAYVLSRKDPYVLQAYGGDLKGNVWRFDLSDPDETKWKAELIAHLVDSNGKVQPITTGIRVEIDQNNNVDRYLFVGTGKLLGQPDLPDVSVINSVYVIKDGNRNTPEPAPITPYSRTNLNTVIGGNIAGFATTPTGRGWYQDALRPDAKIVTDVYADVQVVVYAFSYPSSDPCEAILAATLFARDLTTGNSVLESAAGGTGGSVVANVDIVGGIAGVTLIQAELSETNLTQPVQIQVTTLTGKVFSFGVHLTGAAGSRHRVSWRLLN